MSPQDSVEHFSSNVVFGAYASLIICMQLNMNMNMKMNMNINMNSTLGTSVYVF